MKKDIRIYKLVGKDKKPMENALSIKQTERIIDLIETNPAFKKLVEKTRTKFNIPPNGFPQDIRQSQEESRLLGEWEFEKSIKAILRKLNLPEYWLSPMQIYMLRNAFLTPVRKVIEIHPPKLNSNPYFDSRRLRIHIRERLTRQELIKIL